MKKVLKTLVICVLAILVLVAAQTLAVLAGQATIRIGMPKAVTPVLEAVIYPVLSFFGLKLIAGKKNGFSLKSYRIDKPQVKWYWALTALALPVAVVMSFVLLNGSWTVNKASAYDRVVLVLYGVLFYSLAAGIVEEMVFRGLIMGTMEREYNLTAAVQICSYYWK